MYVRYGCALVCMICVVDICVLDIAGVIVGHNMAWPTFLCMNFGYANFLGVLNNKPPIVTFGSFWYQLFVFSESSFRLEGYLMRY